MKTAVRYYTRSGNTRRLAQAIAQAIGEEAASLASPLAEHVDILFLGCSYYAFDMDPAVKEFLAQNREYIGKLVCFGTSAMMRSMKKPMQKVADAYGIALASEEYHCRGEFHFANKGRPHAEDLKQAAAFAERVVQAHG